MDGGSRGPITTLYWVTWPELDQSQISIGVEVAAAAARGAVPRPELNIQRPTGDSASSLIQTCRLCLIQLSI